MSNATDKKEVQINKIIHKLLERKMVIDNRINGEDLAIIRRAVRQDFRPINKVAIYTTTAEEFSKHFKRLGYSEAEAQECIGYNFNKGIFDNTTPLSSNSTLWDVKEELVALYGCMYKTGYVQLPSSVQDMSIEDLKQDIYVVFGGSLKFNTITKKIEYVGFDNIKTKYKGKTLEDYVKDTMYLYCRPKYRGISRELIGQYVTLVAEQASYNPVRDMLSNSKWDGVDRYPVIYEYLQQDDPMLQGIIKKWLIQCVALAFNSGYDQAETVLTLLGQQRCGKTMFFKALVPNDDWFRSIQSFDPKNKDSYITSISVWIAELSEVESLYRKEQDAVKTFLTQEKDTIRFPYDRDTRTMPRNTCFGATVNKRDFIGDDEARRWFVIEMQNSSLHLIDKLKANALQIWAQVYQDYLKDKTGYRLTVDEVKLIKRNNANSYTQELWGEAAILSLDEYRDGFTSPDNGKPKRKVKFKDMFDEVMLHGMRYDYDRKPAIGSEEYRKLLKAARSLAARYGIRETKPQGYITFNLVDVGEEEAPF